MRYIQWLILIVWVGVTGRVSFLFGSVHSLTLNRTIVEYLVPGMWYSYYKW